MSELDAVNAILANVSESPVDSVTQTTFDLGILAYTKLKEVSYEVQSRGWAFNFESEFPLTINPLTGAMSLPNNVSRVRVSDSMANLYAAAQRGNQLYDPINHTFDFRTALGTNTTLKVDIVFILDWDSLPSSARWYIMVRAARRLADGHIASGETHQFGAQEELDALTMLKEAEGEVGEYNILMDSWSVFRVIDRGLYSFGNFV